VYECEEIEEWKKMENIYFKSGSILILYILLRPILILVHECGHFMAATFYGWKIFDLHLSLFEGGYIVFFAHENATMFQHFVMGVSGGVFELLFVGLLVYNWRDLWVLGISGAIYGLWEGLTGMVRPVSPEVFLEMYNILCVVPTMCIIILVLVVIYPIIKYEWKERNKYRECSYRM